MQHHYKVGDEVEVRLRDDADHWERATITDTCQPVWAGGRVYGVQCVGDPWYWREEDDIRPLQEPTVVGNTISLPASPVDTDNTAAPEAYEDAPGTTITQGGIEVPLEKLRPS